MVLRMFLQIAFFFTLLLQSAAIICALPVDSHAGKTAAQTPIEQHYRAYADENLSAYLDTLLFENDAARWRAKRGLTRTWKNVKLQKPTLQIKAAKEKELGNSAVVHFIVEYQLVFVVANDVFAKHEENFALLNATKSGWKIRRIIAAGEIDKTPQALNEKDLLLWQQDVAQIKELLASTSTNGVATAVATVEKIAPAADILEGLILSYDFTQKPVDNRLEDLSGNGYTALLKGPVWSGANGLYFDGKDDYIKVDGSEKVHSDKALTVIGEFIVTGYTGKAWQNLFWKGNAPDCTTNCENREFALWLNSNAFLHSTSTSRAGIGKGQTFLNSRAGSIVGRTVFSQVIDTASKTMKVYINGKESASTPYSASGLRQTDGSLLIGGGAPVNAGWTFRGYMRWFRIYDRALSKEEINTLILHHSQKPAQPWRDPYQLSDAIIKGGWSTVSPIQDDLWFAKFDPQKIKPGITVENGWYCTPRSGHKTEIVFHHDGSPLPFSGLATMLECFDYCAHSGQVEQIILGDGKQLWSSGLIKQQDAIKSFDIDLTGIREIRLVTTDGGNGEGEDWAAWLNLKLTVPEPGSEPVPVKKPKLPHRTEVTAASTAVGAVDAIYTLDHRPKGTNFASVTNFTRDPDRILVWFLYSKLEEGDVLTGVWTDVGRQLHLRSVPVIITEPQGAAGFTIRRPVDGWTRGHYEISINKGKNTLNHAEFDIGK